MIEEQAKKAIDDIHKVIASALVLRPQRDGYQIVLNAIRTIDEYITGKTTNRNLIDDSRDAKELSEGGSWLVYLSDGGYTRIMIDPVAEPNKMWLTGNIGHYDWKTVKDKWDSIYTTY